MEMKYSLAFPGRQLFVLPTDLVHDYAWKPEHEICNGLLYDDRNIAKITVT